MQIVLRHSKKKFLYIMIFYLYISCIIIFLKNQINVKIAVNQINAKNSYLRFTLMKFKRIVSHDISNLLDK